MLVVVFVGLVAGDCLKFTLTPAAAPLSTSSSSKPVVLKMLVNNNDAGHIIGKRGATVNELQVRFVFPLVAVATSLMTLFHHCDGRESSQRRCCCCWLVGTSVASLVHSKLQAVKSSSLSTPCYFLGPICALCFCVAQWHKSRPPPPLSCHFAPRQRSRFVNSTASGCAM